MDTKLVKKVKMVGPSLTDPTKTVEANVPVADIIAYQQSGYTLGELPKDAVVEVEDAPPVKKGKK